MSAQPVALLLLLALASLTGCNALRAPSSAHTSAPFEPTALIIADESRPLTVEELAAQRPAIVAYLVRRGYLKTPDAIVDNPARASRIIRVILSPSGSFRITEFTLGNRARQIITTTYFSGHPDDYLDGRYGYYNYANARADYPRSDGGPTIPPAVSPPAGNPPERPRDEVRPRRHERRINPEGRGPERTARENPRYENSGGGSSAPSNPPSSPPPSGPPPESRSSGESRFEERNRPHDP